MSKTVKGIIPKDQSAGQLDSVSKRLRHIVDTLGVKQSHMAEKLGISPSGLNYILNSNVKFSKNAKKIADYLNVNEQWLETGQGDIYEENTSIKTYKIPTYYPDQLKLSYRSQQTKKITANDFFISRTPYQNGAISIYITEANFAPKFEISDVIVFEHVDTFEDGEILLVYLAEKNAICLKYGFNLENSIILISLETTPTKLALDNGDVIIGAFRECLKSKHPSALK